ERGRASPANGLAPQETARAVKATPRPRIESVARVAHGVAVVPLPWRQRSSDLPLARALDPTAPGAFSPPSPKAGEADAEEQRTTQGGAEKAPHAGQDPPPQVATSPAPRWDLANPNRSPRPPRSRPRRAPPPWWAARLVTASPLFPYDQDYR